MGVGLGGFWLGGFWSQSGDGVATNPTPTITATVSPTPVTSLPPGNYDYQRLLTGSCLAEFPGAWELTYQVAACSAPHAAQVIRAGQVPGFTATEFPGEAAVQSAVLPLCSAPGVIDTNAAQTNPNVVVTFVYPVTAAQWRATTGAYVCFASNLDGAPLTGSLVPPVG